MRQGWKEYSLREVCDLFTDGDWIESKDQASDGIRLIQTGNIGLGKFKNRQNKARFISNQTFCELKCTEVYPGDLLVSRLPDPVGRSCIIPDLGTKLITAVDCTILRPKKDLLWGRYLMYYQMSREYFSNIYGKVTGATRSRISRKNLGKVEIPIPPLPEQKRIVAILDEAFAAIDQAKANIERNIENAEELFQSKLEAVFSERGEGWEERKLLDISNATSNIKWNETQGKRRYIDLSSVSRKSLKIVDTDEIDYNNAPSRAKKIVKKKDVIFGTTRPTLKRVAIIEDKYHNQICSTGFYVIRPKEGIITSEFIFLFLQTRSFMDRMKSIQSGASYPAVNYSDMKNSIISFPVSTVKQAQIASNFFDLQNEKNKVIQSYIIKLGALEELKKSILQKAFTGELTAKESVA